MYYSNDSQILSFAFSEFRRLLCDMDRNASVERASELSDNVLSFSICPEHFSVNDPVLDDGYQISISNVSGVIAAPNERSILLGVYRFFSELGCLFSRPGKDGEIVPHADSRTFSVEVDELAAYRHRGLCIEGSNSFENVAEMIDYLPKIGCNTYFFQFFVPYEFFDRWYGHSSNPDFISTPLGKRSVECFLADYEQMLKKRGILYHSVGHGWTAKVIGVPADGWYDASNDMIPPENRDLLAMLNGKRLLFPSDSSPKNCGVPLNTSLCYANAVVQEKLATEITNYCLAHRELNYIHIWLADSNNNQCECNNCVKARPSDFYVDILNRCDEMLSENNCSIRLVFLIYQDLIWAPLRSKLKNPSRFTLMFAPITRTYSSNYSEATQGTTLPYHRNHITLPKSLNDSLAYLVQWQEGFSGDSFLYDYHYMWDHYYDMGNCSIAHTLCEDIKALKSWGLNGFISCQVTRCQMPTGWGLYALGHCLWKGALFDEESAKKNYFNTVYGREGSQVRKYLETLSNLSCAEYCRGETGPVSKESYNKFTQIPHLAEKMRFIAKKHLSGGPLKLDRAWTLLWLHSYLAEAQAKFLSACAIQDESAIASTRDEFIAMIRKLETLSPQSMESHEYIRTFSAFFKYDKF